MDDYKSSLPSSAEPMMPYDADISPREPDAWLFVIVLRLVGYSYQQVAAELTRLGYRNSKGRAYNALQVWHFIRRLEGA